MTIVNRIYLLAGLVWATACAENVNVKQPLEPQETGQSPVAVSWREQRLALGRDTYEQACASCHDEGTGGAPVIGDRDTWSGRSSLWSVVLLAHAKAGYLQMPAKGGHPELTDQSVEAAGEYMLGATYPELPVD